MSEQTQEVQTAREAIPAHVQIACDIATGKATADPAEAGYVITGARKDLNSRGRGPEWYRMVYRKGDWRYVSNERLPRGNFLASDRRASVSGDVYTGEIIASHDRGQPIDIVWILTAPNGDGPRMTKCEFKKRRDGDIGITLPDGSEITLPNPRK